MIKTSGIFKNMIVTSSTRTPSFCSDKNLSLVIIIITFLFTQGMPKQLKTGFHWGPACVNIKIEYREYGNRRQNNNYIPHHK